MRKFLAIILACLTCVFCISCSDDSTGNSTFDKETLTITYEKNLKIVQLTDIQGETVEEIQSAFDDYVDKAIEKTNPNLIVLTGDNVDKNSTKEVFACFVEEMEKFKIPWAPVFGNHDDENNNGVTKTFMADTFENAEYCLFDRGDFVESNCVGNYVVKLKKKNDIKYNLIFLDSNSYVSTGYDAIHSEQIEWYKDVVNSTKVGGNVIPSMLFFHIPIPEYALAFFEYDLNYDIHLPFTLPDGKGFIGERVSHPSVANTGLFSVVTSLGSTKAIFCGHDHDNYCDVDYQGVRLNYGLKSSMNSYANYPDNIGVKLITINKNDTFGIESVFYNV